MGYWGDLKDDDEGMAPSVGDERVPNREGRTASTFGRAGAVEQVSVSVTDALSLHARALSDAEEAAEELAIGLERVAGATCEAVALIKWTRLWLWGVVVLQLVELACLIRLTGGR